MKKILIKLISFILLVAVCVPIFAACNRDEREREEAIKSYDDGSETFNPYPYKDLSVYMDLPEYKDFKVSRSEVDDMMRVEISSFCIKNGLALDVTSGGAQKYDTVQIFYVCYIDGQSVEELSNREYDGSFPIDLYLGSGALPFEDGVVGMTVGETKLIELTLPQDYPYAYYRGKEAAFSVTLDGITRIPELTDKMCADYSIYENKEEFLQALEENCVFDLMWQTLMGKCSLKAYPNAEYTQYYQYFYGYFEALAEAEDMTLAVFLDKKGGMYTNYGLWRGITVVQFRSVAENYAKSNVINDLLTYSVMRAENIKLKGKEWDEAIAVLEKEYGTTYKELVRASGETAAIISVLNIRIAKVFYGYATITSD